MLYSLLVSGSHSHANIIRAFKKFQSILCIQQNFVMCYPEHTQDKQIHRDDEYYEGDNDNDHDDGTRWSVPLGM